MWKRCCLHRYRFIVSVKLYLLAKLTTFQIYLPAFCNQICIWSNRFSLCNIQHFNMLRRYGHIEICSFLFDISHACWSFYIIQRACRVNASNCTANIDNDQAANYHIWSLIKFPTATKHISFFNFMNDWLYHYVFIGPLNLLTRDERSEFHQFLITANRGFYLRFRSRWYSMKVLYIAFVVLVFLSKWFTCFQFSYYLIVHW